MLLEPHVERVLRHFRSVPGRGPSSADGSHFACAVRFDDGVSKSFEYFRRDGRDIRRTSGPLIAASLRVAPEGDELLAFSQYFQALAVLKEVSALEDLLALSQTHGDQPAGGVCARSPGRFLADQVAEDLVDPLGDLCIVDVAVDGDHVIKPDRYADVLVLAPGGDLLRRRDMRGPAGEADRLPVAVLPARHLADRLEGGRGGPRHLRVLDDREDARGQPCGDHGIPVSGAGPAGVSYARGHQCLRKADRKM